MQDPWKPSIARPECEQLQLLLFQLNVDASENSIREAFEKAKAPVSHVYLAGVALERADPPQRSPKEQGGKVERWCLGYAFCCLERRTDLSKALGIRKVGPVTSHYKPLQSWSHSYQKLGRMVQGCDTLCNSPRYAEHAHIDTPFVLAGRCHAL
jgi:hypothetical protein